MSRSVVYSCPFVPAEWIAAHGFAPSRTVGASQHAELSSVPVQGVCPYARTFAGSALACIDAAAVIVTTVCDQMRRVADALAADSDVPVFLMNVPHTWKTPAARGLYASELERLGRFLVRLGGAAPTHDLLVEIILQFDAERQRLYGLRDKLSPRDHSEALMEWHRTGAMSGSGSGSAAGRRGIPLALAGGPMMPEDMELFKHIEEAGGYVALDATETGERGLPAAYDPSEVRRDPVSAIVDAYFGSIPDPFRRPNDGFFQWLRNKCAERGIRGVILRRYIWCDNWHAEADRIRDVLGLPFLHLDVSGDASSQARTLTRLQALMEMLR